MKTNPTHILILIKDIEDRITKLKQEKHYDEWSDNVAYGRIDILEDLLTDYKQISLNEKEIEEKGKKYIQSKVEGWVNFSEGSFELDCYKQALKDLL